MTLLTLFGLLSTAHAVPVQLSQQGRLLDSNGAAYSGVEFMSFRLYGAPFGGVPLWEEPLQVTFINGYYAVVLGANSASNPLEDAVLASHPLYLEIEIGGNGPIGIRQEVISSPYARLSGSATNVIGGTVDASEVSVAGQLVIDSSGSWVGPASVMNWGDLQNVPSDIADGDDDTLAGISCNAGEILGWNGTQWGCAADNGLTEAEVESFVTNDPLDLASGSLVGGLPILTEGHSGTLSGLSCQDGELAKWDMVLGGWACAIDIDTDTDTDTQLSEADVENFVVNDPLDLASGSMVAGLDIVASAGCNDGEFLSWEAATQSWTCVAIYGMFDADNDGVMAWSDCDDTDPAAGSNVGDQDCDGIAATNDCNDFDPSSAAIADDGDCDGFLTVNDCDDADPNMPANDADCDGVASLLDCDDADPLLPSTDADCDGFLTVDDCDDTDPNVGEGDGTTQDCAADSCLSILNNGDSTGNGLYWIDPQGQGAFETYCDMTHDGGGWTLMMSVVDDARQLQDWTTDNQWNYPGQNRWQDQTTFGTLQTATTSQTGDYKNPAYWLLNGDDIMVAHVPNNTAIDDIMNNPLYVYRTTNGFLNSYGNSLYSLYTNHFPLNNGNCSQGVRVNVTYDVGSGSSLHSRQNSNSRNETNANEITFKTINNEGHPHAFCPVGYTGCNSEHSCIGGNGTTSGRGEGGWGNFNEWNYDSSWGFDTTMQSASVMFFVR